jgi:hypothetical protein
MVQGWRIVDLGESGTQKRSSAELLATGLGGLKTHRRKGGRLYSLHFAPPGRLLDAEEVDFFAAGEVEVENIVFVKHATVGPAGILWEVIWRIVLVDKGDVVRAARDDSLRFERERGARGRIRRNLVGDLGEHQDCHKCSNKDRDLLHRRSSPQRRAVGPQQEKATKGRELTRPQPNLPGLESPRALVPRFRLALSFEPA